MQEYTKDMADKTGNICDKSALIYIYIYIYYQNFNVAHSFIFIFHVYEMEEKQTAFKCWMEDMENSSISKDHQARWRNLSCKMFFYY